jgi:hypothetical protein
MVDIMLRDAMQRDIDRYACAGRPITLSSEKFVQPVIRQFRDSLKQSLVTKLKGSQALHPSRATGVGDRRPISFFRKFDPSSFDSRTHSIFPRRDVKNDFPNAVRAGQRPGGSLLCRDISDKLPERRPIKGVSVERSSELIFDSFKLSQ